MPEPDAMLSIVTIVHAAELIAIEQRMGIYPNVPALEQASDSPEPE